MTLLTTAATIQYDGLIGQDAFAYNFRVDKKTDMNVLLDGSLMDQGDFSITNLGEPNGGVVTLNTPLSVEAVVVLARIVPATQEVDYQPFDAFPAETHEGALDKLTMLSQQNEDAIRRSFRFPIGDESDPVLPEATARSLLFLSFDAVGDIALVAGTGGGDPNAVQKPLSSVTAGNLMVFDAAKNSIDAGETPVSILSDADAYTDGVDTSNRVYTDSQDTAVLADAKSYADIRDAATLASAKTYADSGDAATIIAANDYTDAQLNAGMQYGYINADGTAINLPVGWTSQSLVIGQYTVTHNIGLADANDQGVVLTAVSKSGSFQMTAHLSPAPFSINSFDVETHDPSGGTTDDAAFSFIWMGNRGQA